MSAPITMTGYMGAIVVGAPFVMDYGNRAAEELVRVADVRPADEACCKVRVEGMTGWFSEIEFRRRAMPFIPATATPGALDPATVERSVEDYAYDELWGAIAAATRVEAGMVAISVVKFREAIRNLATDPYQHGAGNGGEAS